MGNPNQNPVRPAVVLAEHPTKANTLETVSIRPIIEPVEDVVAEVKSWVSENPHRTDAGLFYSSILYQAVLHVALDLLIDLYNFLPDV
jgi:hypothetical protein